MKRLTPQEFAAQWQDPRPIKVIKFGEQPTRTIHEESFVELLQAYAEHLEETAWVKDGSLPPVEVRVDVTDGKIVCEAKIRHRDKRWYGWSLVGDEYLERITAWRYKSQPPKP